MIRKYIGVHRKRSTRKILKQKKKFNQSIYRRKRQKNIYAWIIKIKKNYSEQNSISRVLKYVVVYTVFINILTLRERL